MTTPKVTAEVRKYLASIGAKGGKAFTEKKKAQLSKIQSKGGNTVTPKKLAPPAQDDGGESRKAKGSARCTIADGAPLGVLTLSTSTRGTAVAPQ
jgi:hypothetical protein